MAEQQDDLLKEGREAAEAAARAARTRSTDDIEAAAKEILDVIRIGMARGFAWPMWAAIAIAIGVGAFSIYRSASPVSAVVKDDPISVQAIKDGFAELKADLKGIAERLDRRPEPLPKPPQPGPDGPPKPPAPGSLSLPEEVKTRVGGGLVKIKAKASGPVTWVVPPVKGIETESEGDKLFLSATADGEYWIGAVTIVGGKVSAPEWVRVIVGTGPRPPPGPEPKPPVPPSPEWPTVVLDQLGAAVAIHAGKVGKKSDAAAMAKIYFGVVADIRSGEITSADVAVRRLFKENTAALGGNAGAWNGFFTWADNELTRRSEKGMLATMKQHADAFEQFAAGLLEASK